MIRFGGVWREPLLAGQVYEVPEDLAAAMVADGRAVLFASEYTVEAAVDGPPENAAKRIGRAKRR